jgi:4-oxalocrotonate tautomerase
MPYVNATLQAPPSAELTAHVPAGQWARGGSALPVRGYFVEVKVMAGTNLRDHKARYVREVNRALQSRLGEASGYVVVEEVPADSWGYAGETQELHYLRNKLPEGAAP